MTPATVLPLSKFPRVYFHAAGKNQKQVSEFETFLGYLLKRDKVSLQFYFLFTVKRYRKVFLLFIALNYYCMVVKSD